MIPAAAPTSAPHRRGGGTRTQTISREAAPLGESVTHLALATRTRELSTTNTTVTEPTCAAPARKKTRRGKRRRSRRPGAWPETPHTHELLAPIRREQARRVLTLGAIRAALEEQPNAACVRQCERRWERALHQLADEVITAKNNREAA